MSYLKTLEQFSIGKIKSIQDNVIIATGLENVFVGEVVKFKSQESNKFQEPKQLPQLVNLLTSYFRFHFLIPHF